VVEKEKGGLSGLKNIGYAELKVRGRKRRFVGGS